MLSSVSVQELRDLIARDHPGWDASVIAQRAEEYRSTMDDRLDPLLRAYLDSGETGNFRSGEVSVIMIQRMRKGRSYFEALTLMDGLLKDPEIGRLRIFRR